MPVVQKFPGIMQYFAKRYETLPLIIIGHRERKRTLPLFEVLLMLVRLYDDASTT